MIATPTSLSPSVYEPDAISGRPCDPVVRKLTVVSGTDAARALQRTLMAEPSTRRQRLLDTVKSWRHLRAGDMRAAWVSAVVMLPQAVAFAVIAGLPPEMGIYASVIPVILAALFGASRRLMSGPNTAVSAMIGAALLPLAVPGSNDYLALVAVLTAMVGATQLVTALLGAGHLLALLPPFVSSGLCAGIGIVMITSQLAPASGLLTTPDIAPWLSALYAALSWESANPYAVAVAVAAIAAGQGVERMKVRGLPPLVAAMLGGTIMAWVLDMLAGSAVTNLDRIGQLQVTLFPWSVPTLNGSEWYVLKQLAHSAVAISVVGGLQTVVISRLIADRKVGEDNPRRELLAQGLANIAASVTGGFAGSGSFNRTAAHVKAGAETPAAAVLSSVILLSLAWLAGPLFAYIAAPAVAGTIILIGWGMLRSGFALLRTDRGFSRAATVATVASVLVAGIESSLTLAALLGFMSIVLTKRASSSEHPHALAPCGTATARLKESST